LDPLHFAHFPNTAERQQQPAATNRIEREQPAAMAWRASLSQSVKEIRVLFCQSSPASAAARYHSASTLFPHPTL
jgi:hypothetical protein